MATPVGPKPETENNNLHSRTGDQGAIDPVRASAEAPAPDLVETLRAEGRHFRGEPDCVGPAVTLLVERAADTITALTADNELLRAALEGMIDMSQYWINLAIERGMSKERYDTWLALGYHSNAMQKARAALTQEPRT